MNNLNIGITGDKGFIGSHLSIAINYFNDKVEPNKRFKTPNSEEKKSLKDLVEKLKSVSQDMKPEDIQTNIS